MNLPYCDISRYGTERVVTVKPGILCVRIFNMYFSTRLSFRCTGESNLAKLAQSVGVLFSSFNRLQDTGMHGEGVSTFLSTLQCIFHSIFFFLSLYFRNLISNEVAAQGRCVSVAVLFATVCCTFFLPSELSRRCATSSPTP